MPTRRCDSITELPSEIQSLFERERRAVMTTIARDGSAHSVPVVFAAIANEIVSPIDHKPKSGRVMARIRNLERDPRVTLLIDHWDEEWTRLTWVMVRGTAIVDGECPADLLHALNARYPQYAPDERHDALIRIHPTNLLWWSWT